VFTQEQYDRLKATFEEILGPEGHPFCLVSVLGGEGSLRPHITTFMPNTPPSCLKEMFELLIRSLDANRIANVPLVGGAQTTFVM